MGSNPSAPTRIWYALKHGTGQREIEEHHERVRLVVPSLRRSSSRFRIRRDGTWNGDVMVPSFSPSFRHGPNIKAVNDDKGHWLGKWFMRDKDGNVVQRGKREPGDTPIMWCCHYIVTNGRVAYCGDSTHEMAGQTIDMPDLPPFLSDGDVPV